MNTPNRHWLRKLLSGTPHIIIGGTDDPYLLRWYVIPRNRVLNVYVHKFLRSDDDRALHDHPWWFASIMLRGRYREWTRSGPFHSAADPKAPAFYTEERRERRAPSIAFRRAEHVHRVELLTDADGITDGPFNELPCWTLIITGPKVRHWGFHCPKGFVPWEKFTSKASSTSETSLGCGEFA